MTIPRFVSAVAGFALAGAAFAQQPYTLSLPIQPSSIPTFATSAEVQAIIKHAQSEMKPGQPVIVQPIHQHSGLTTFIEVRRGGWTAATHPDTELFYVVRGKGTLIMGGAIPDAKPGKGGNTGGASITGGQTIKVGPSDFFMVPPETAHQFPAPDGELVLISMHIPRADAPAKP